MKLLRKLIRTGYKALSIANTTDVILSGKPRRIAKHLARKKTVRAGSRVIR